MAIMEIGDGAFGCGDQFADAPRLLARLPLAAGLGELIEPAQDQPPRIERELQAYELPLDRSLGRGLGSLDAHRPRRSRGEFDDVCHGS
ncbi:MAG: hypothetical protein E6614_30865, partial [Bradyrhizobium sp.]|nr:hypothetical protein [Bradyrhizobium sp.]